MATQLFSLLTSSLSFEGIDIDNWTFKLYSKASAGIFFLAAALSTMNTYTGDAITCTKSAGDYAKQYCWLHGVRHLKPNEIANAIHLGDACFSYGGDDKVTNYYIWISLVLIFSSVLFFLPNQLWKFLEGGMMEQFGSSRREFLEDAEKSASVFKKMSKNHTKLYFFTFVFFEILNFVTGVTVFLLTDWFLDQNFSTYGSKTIAYLRGSGETTEVDIGGQTKSVKLNPMCSVFPTSVRCDTTVAGVNGVGDELSDLCILGQNIMNQKIYLVLWIWFVVLFSVSACMIVYRVLTCILPGFQRKEIQGYLKSSDDYAVRRLRLDFDHIGNYFVLTQIGRNATPYTFRKFLDEVVDRPNKTNEKEKEKTEKTIVVIDESNEATWNISGMKMGHMDGN